MTCTVHVQCTSPSCSHVEEGDNDGSGVEDREGTSGGGVEDSEGTCGGGVEDCKGTSGSRR